MYAFITAKNNTTGNVDVLVQKIDEYIKPVGLPKILGSIPAANYIDKSHIQIKTSANKNYISLMFLTKNMQEGVLNLWVFNSMIEQTYAKQFNLNTPYKNIFITNYEVSNNADVYMLIDYPKNDNTKRNDIRDFYIYGYTPKYDKMLQYQISNDSIFVEDITIGINNLNNTVTVAGFYSKPLLKTIAGYFYIRINYNNTLVETKNYYTLNYFDFYANYTGRMGDKNTDLSDLYVRKIIPRSDGGAIMIAEKFFITRQVYNYFVGNIPQTTTRTIYNYNEAPLINIDADGKISDMHWIKKNQTSANDGGYLLSFITLNMMEFLSFVYNVDNGTDNEIMMSTLTFNNKYNASILVKSTGFSAAIIPMEFKQINAKSALLCAIKDKRFVLMRLTF